MHRGWESRGGHSQLEVKAEHPREMSGGPFNVWSLEFKGNKGLATQQ